MTLLPAVICVGDVCVLIQIEMYINKRGQAESILQTGSLSTSERLCDRGSENTEGHFECCDRKSVRTS